MLSHKDMFGYCMNRLMDFGTDCLPELLEMLVTWGLSPNEADAMLKHATNFINLMDSDAKSFS